MTNRVAVRYATDPSDLSTFYLAVVPANERRAPSPDEWKPAYRDSIDGRLVLWARFERDQGIVWLREPNGDRIVQRDS